MAPVVPPSVRPRSPETVDRNEMARLKQDLENLRSHARASQNAANEAGDELNWYKSEWQKWNEGGEAAPNDVPPYHVLFWRGGH